METEAIYTRRSIRKFQAQPITRECIDAILDAGRMAPSAKNRQPWKCIVLTGQAKEHVNDLMEQGIAKEQTAEAVVPGFAYGIMDAKNTLRVMGEAPVVILILNTNGTTPFQPVDTEGRFVEICDSLSIGAFIQNMLLKAEALGIGSLWIGNTCFAYEEIARFLKTKDQIIGAVAFGYADEQPAQRARKQLSEIVEYLE